jgi:AcrR family transcriptional regulator
LRRDFHFPSKDALLDALAERLAAPVGEAVEAQVSDPSIPVPRRLQNTLSAVLDLIEIGRPHLTGLVKPGNEGLHYRVGNALRAHLQPTFSSLVAEGNADGTLAVDPAAETVELLLSTVFHLIRAHAHGEDPDRVARMRIAAEQLFARGLVLPDPN